VFKFVAKREVFLALLFEVTLGEAGGGREGKEREIQRQLPAGDWSEAPRARGPARSAGGMWASSVTGHLAGIC
jgi:hypothetical protein